MNEDCCRHFRHKSMYVPGEYKDLAETEAKSGGAAFCWCNCTMAEIGVDDRLVSLADCSSPERACRRPR